jgi:UDP-2,4-diacetamido-2,4,6-trideoxy-beta-L-altropyranose hydrolase
LKARRFNRYSRSAEIHGSANDIPVLQQMKPGSLVIRADANVSIGTGHVMRCLALAEAWQDAGGSASFLSAELPDALRARITANGIRLVHVDAIPGSSQDAVATAAQARQLQRSWTVVDGDRFPGDFLENLHGAGVRVLLVDDFADRDVFPVDLIVNPNLGVDTQEYRARGSHTQVLVGPKYVLLRREFHRARQRRTDSKGNRVLVTLGGSDPGELTQRIAAALVSCADLQLMLVAGAGYSKVTALQKVSAPNIRVIVDSQNIADLMSESDLAVIAAGGTLWELLSMGCVVLSYARNTVQKRVVRSLAKDGVVVDMGETVDFSAASLVSEVRRLADSQALREQMAARGRRLVDGLGAARVVEAMLHLGAH